MISKRRWSASLVIVLTWSCREQPMPPPASGSPQGTPTRLLAVGELAPDFSALSQTGYQVALGDFLDKPVAVYFCPSGLDSSCTTLMVALRDQWLAMNHRLGMLLFVVPSNYNENRAHATQHELPFLVLADTTGSVSSSYGLGIGNTLAHPIGVLVGKDRRIQSVLAGPNEAEHVAVLGRELP